MATFRKWVDAMEATTVPVREQVQGTTFEDYTFCQDGRGRSIGARFVIRRVAVTAGESVPGTLLGVPGLWWTVDVHGLRDGLPFGSSHGTQWFGSEEDARIFIMGRRLIRCKAAMKKWGIPRDGWATPTKVEVL